MAENTKLLKYLLVFLPILILLNISFAQEWLSGWTYRIPITISEKSGNDLPIYQIYFDLNRDFLNRYPSLTRTSEFVFTDSDGATLIPYWIEKIPYQGISAEAYYSLESERCFYYYEILYNFPSTPNKLETNWWDNNLLANPQYNDVFVRINFTVDDEFKSDKIILVVEGDDGFALYVNDYFIDAKGSLAIWFDYNLYCYNYYYYCYYCYGFICERCIIGEYYPECDLVCPNLEWYCRMCNYCASNQYMSCHVWQDLYPSRWAYDIKNYIRSGYNEIKIWCSKETENGSCRFKIIVDDGVISTNIQNYDTFGRVWIKVPNITANSNKTIYMYYGINTTLKFNGDDVFDFFDDFNSDNLNEYKWVYYGEDSIVIENNKLRIVTDNNPPTGTIQSLNPITLNNYALEFKVKVVSEPQENCNFGIMDSDRGDGKGYWPFFSYGGKVNIYKRSNGNWELLESIDGAYTLEKTHVARIVKNGNSYTYYIDDTQIGQTYTVDTGPETYIISPRIWGEYIGESCFMYFDDLKVRRYVYPEPDIAFGEAENLIISVGPPTIVPSGKFKAFNVSENIGINRTNYVYTISVKDMNCFRIYAEEEVNEMTIGGERRYVPVRVVDWNESECKVEVLLNLSKDSWKVVYIGESLTDIDYSYYDEIFKEYGNFFVPFEKRFPVNLSLYLVVKSYWFNRTTAMLFISARPANSWLRRPSRVFIWNILNNSVVDVPGYFWRDYRRTMDIQYNSKALYYSKSKGIGLTSYEYRLIGPDGEDCIAAFTENVVWHAFDYPGLSGGVTSLDCNETDSEIVCYFVHMQYPHVGKIRIYPNVEFLGEVTYLPFYRHPYAVKIVSNGKYIWFGGQQCFSPDGFYVARYNTETNQFDVIRFIHRFFSGECPGAIGDIECIDENNCIATSEYTLFKITPTETIDILPEIRLSKDECWNEGGNLRCFTSSLHKFDNNVFYFTYFEDYVSDSKVIRYDYNRNKFYEYAWLRYDGKNVSQLHATAIKSMMLYDDTTGIFSGILRTGYYDVEQNRYISQDYGNILMIRQQDVQEIEVTTPPQYPEYCEFVVNSSSTLSTEGYYCLVNNITEITLDTIFSINSNNVIFDCLGNSIISNGKNVFYLNSVSNITIKNCVIKNSKIDGSAYLLNITNNTLISEDAFTISSFYCEDCHIFNNTLISITNGIRRVHISLRPQAKNIYIYDNILMAENTTAISYDVNDALTHIGTSTAENVYIFNNYGYSDYGSLGIGPTSLSNYVINMEMYNNTIIAPNSVLCSQIANCFNCSASFNNFTCLWIMSFNNNTENVYVYNNTIDKYNISNWEGRCLYNVYAYNNSVNKVFYMNLVYGHNFCMNNVYIPTTETLDSYISVLIDYDELNYGDVYPNNYYDIVKQISINTNRIDYYIDFDSSGLSYEEYNISKENLYVSMSNSTQFSKIFSLPLRATYLKSAILETVNILHRIYIPNVPPGLYTGKIYITFGLGEVSNYNFGGEI